MKISCRVFIVLFVFLAGLARAQPKEITLRDGDITIAQPPPGAVNLIRNGGFEEPNDKGTGPRYWQDVERLVHHWTTDPSAPDRGKIIRIDTDVNQSQAYQWWADHFVRGVSLDKAPAKTPTRPPKYDTIGGLDGGFYASDVIPVKPGGAYKVYVDAKGGTAMVFIFGYDRDDLPLSFGDEQPATQQMFRKARGDPLDDKRGRPIKYRLRYFYRSWFMVGGSPEWQSYTHKMPRHPNDNEMTEDVRFIRIQIYAFWPPGEYAFDNVRVIEVEEER